MDVQSALLLCNNEGLTPVVCFHSQQAVEKSLKALFEENNVKIPKIHSTVHLYSQIKAFVDIQVDIEMLSDIDDVYIDSRYPGDSGLLPDGAPTLEDAKEFYEFAKSVYERVVEFIERG